MHYPREEMYTFLSEKKVFGPPSLNLQWHITDCCNFRCKHCYQETYSSEELPFQALNNIVEQYKELLDKTVQISKPFPVRGHINVTGGEPFVRDDFIELLEILSANRDYFSFGILSNGSYIDEKMAEKLRDLGVRNVQVSIEGLKKTNDKIRAPGSFDDAVSALKNLVRVGGIVTGISFTASQKNYREFSKVARLGCYLGVAMVWSDRLVPYGSGINMDCLSPEETREYVNSLYKAKKEAKQGNFRTRIGTHRALQFLGTDEQDANEQPYHCGAAEKVFIIMPNGDLCPCRRMPIIVGNVMRNPLKELFYTNDLFLKLRDRENISKGCEDCLYKLQCRGGLKCLSYAVTGDPFKADPGCWLASNEVSNRA